MKQIILTLAFVLSLHNLSSQSLELLSHYEWGYGASNLWGYTAPNGREYACVGLLMGLGIVDITDPANPVEVFHWDGQTTIWRELKVYNGYLYMTMETSGQGQNGDGLVIVDMNGAPDNFTVHQYYGQESAGISFETCHTLFIDEQGICYLFGCNYLNGGAIMLDLTADPINPPIVGVYDEEYIHDGFARQDTLWAGEIYAGHCSVVDMSDLANPQVITTQKTPDEFTHNTWKSDDNKYLFTTDEVAYAKVACYDVSDINDIKFVGQVSDAYDGGSIPHNTYYHNGYIVTSWYQDGLRIHDATQPMYLPEMAKFDTHPEGNGSDFNGCWGVYPYFPSGNIIASDMANGLWVLAPTYVHATFLSGTVQNISNDEPIIDAEITISTGDSVITNQLGQYFIGYYSDEPITITIDALGYQPLVINDIQFTIGSTTVYDFNLIPLQAISLTVQVEEEGGIPVEGATVEISTYNGLFNAITESDGIIPATNVYEGQYKIVVGKWGYHTVQYDVYIDGFNLPYIIDLPRGYYDDYYFDYGWEVTGNSTSGAWERGVPVGNMLNNTPSNPYEDAPNDIGEFCMVTGNAGGSAGDDDVDDGYTLLTSPLFDLSDYTNPIISYNRWFSNMGGNGQKNDSLLIHISNGDSTVLCDLQLGAGNNQLSQWISYEFMVKDYVSLSDSMTLSIYTADQQNTGHMLDAAFDLFSIRDTLNIEPIDTSTSIQNINAVKMLISPNPFMSEIRWQLSDTYANVSYMEIYDLLGQLKMRIDIVANQGIINLSTFANGMYLLKASDQNHKTIYQTQIIKQE